MVIIIINMEQVTMLSYLRIVKSFSRYHEKPALGKACKHGCSQLPSSPTKHCPLVMSPGNAPTVTSAAEFINTDAAEFINTDAANVIVFSNLYLFASRCDSARVRALPGRRRQ